MWTLHETMRLAGSATCLALACSAARAESLFEAYRVAPQRTFLLPTLDAIGQQPPTAFDVLADGRIVAIATDDADSAPQNFSSGTPHLFVESAVGSRDFQSVGMLPLPGAASPELWPDFGASFLSVSPSGDRVAVGNNNGRVGVFSTTGLQVGGPVPTVDWFQTDHFQGGWIDEQSLMLSNTSGVIALNSATGTETLIVDGFVASAGVALDGDGNLLAADGFGADAGLVRRFERSVWEEALNSGAPLSFAAGEDITRFSSAASLDIDAEGNLLVGGGRFDLPLSQSNGIAVIRPEDGAQRIFDPNDVDNANGNFYTVRSNPVTGEVYVYEPFALNVTLRIDNRRVFVMVPEASALTMAAGALVFLLIAARSRAPTPARES